MVLSYIEQRKSIEGRTELKDREIPFSQHKGKVSKGWENGSFTIQKKIIRETDKSDFSDSRLQITNYELRITNYELPIYYKQSRTYS